MTRTILRLDIKNDWVVKGRQFEGVRKITAIDDQFQLPPDIQVEEIFLLDTTRSFFGLEPNFSALKKIAKKTLLPITFGGGISTIEQALEAFHQGASRIYINSAASRNPKLVPELVNIVGAQAIVGGCEYRIKDGKRECYIDSGREPLDELLHERVDYLLGCGIGELICCSIDSDGLLTGLDYDVIDQLSISVPLVLSGGGAAADLQWIYADAPNAEGYCFSTELIKKYD